MPIRMATMVGLMGKLESAEPKGNPDTDGAAGLAWRAAISDAHDPEDVLEAISMAAFASGAEPHSRTVEVRRLPVDIDFSGFGGRVVREYRSNRRTTTLVVGDGWTMKLIRYRDGEADGWITAVNAELTTEVARSITKQDLGKPDAPEKTIIGFWHRDSHGAERRERVIEAPAWADIEQNYAPAARQALAALLRFDAAPTSGQLVLLHGPPGTGKSTLIRALARAWKPWCGMEYVVDPDQLFTSSPYLAELLLDDNESGQWRLVVLEDCDELIRPDAKPASGQALSRLLNLTDGLIGRGRRILVLITTNEDLRRLHPAVTRPGRCLANIEVGRLPVEQAAALLGASGRAGLPVDGLTLAEVYARRSGTRPWSGTDAVPAPGQYL